MNLLSTCADPDMYTMSDDVPNRYGLWVWVWVTAESLNKLSQPNIRMLFCYLRPSLLSEVFLHMHAISIRKVRVL